MTDERFSNYPLLQQALLDGRLVEDDGQITLDLATPQEQADLIDWIRGQTLVTAGRLTNLPFGREWARLPEPSGMPLIDPEKLRQDARAPTEIRLRVTPAEHSRIVDHFGQYSPFDGRRPGVMGLGYALWEMGRDIQAILVITGVDLGPYCTTAITPLRLEVVTPEYLVTDGHVPRVYVPKKGKQA
jgi:hypothetical protein